MPNLNPMSLNFSQRRKQQYEFMLKCYKKNEKDLVNTIRLYKTQLMYAKTLTPEQLASSNRYTYGMSIPQLKRAIKKTQDELAQVRDSIANLKENTAMTRQDYNAEMSFGKWVKANKKNIDKEIGTI